MMTDRNDRLLLALGWERRRHGSLGYLWRTKEEAEAGIPFSGAKIQRDMNPFDSVDDALKLVPKGWQHWEAYCSAAEGGRGIWTWTLRHAKSGKEVFAQASTAAEALALAITEAVK